MPYIKQEQRDKLDPSIRLLIKSLQEDKDNLDGNFNYAVTRLLKSLYSPPKYATYARAMGALVCIQQEFYRKVVAPYENIKEEENGKIPD